MINVPEDEDHDALPEVPTAFATAWAVAGFVCAAVALVFLPFLVGAAGMVAGTIAHLKQSRLGMPAAIASGITLILGTANEFLLRS